MPFVSALVPVVDLSARRRRGRRPARAALARPGRGHESDAHRHRLDLPGLPRAAAALVAGQGPRRRPRRRTRARPAGLGPRPPPHRRRHPVRRWGGHGHEARAVGRGARRAARRRARGRASTDAVLVVPTPAGAPFTQDVAAELVGPGPAGDRLRPLRGDRPAGARPRGHPDAGVRGVGRRLRPQRWRGRPPSWWSRRSSGCSPASWATRNRSSRSPTARTACWSTPSTPSRPSWRGLDVPPVLLGGDHARIAAWRHEQALQRTAERRPDLLHPSRTVTAGGDSLELRAAAPCRRRRGAHAAAGVLGRGGASQPRRRDPAHSASGCRRWRRGCRSGPPWCCEPARDSSVPSAVASRATCGTSAG